jgi:hypothetical protein
LALSSADAVADCVTNNEREYWYAVIHVNTASEHKHGKADKADKQNYGFCGVNNAHGVTLQECWRTAPPQMRYAKSSFTFGLVNGAGGSSSCSHKISVSSVIAQPES